MVSFSSIALLSFAAIGAIAAPAKRNGSDHSWGQGQDLGHGHGQCLTYNDASLIAQKYGELIATYTNATADAILTPSFIDYSESVNTLINSCPQGDAAKPLPLLDPTFNNLQEFKVGQGQQPPINFEQLQLWYSCSAVTIRWKTTNTANITDVKPVIGLIVMETVPAPAGNAYPYQIDRVYSEFDAGAWLQNLQEAGICTHATSTLPDPTVSQPAQAAPPAASSVSSAASTASPYAAVTSPGGSVVQEAPAPPTYRARLMV